MPRRLVTPGWWVRHRVVLAIVLAWVGIAIGAIGVAHHLDTTDQKVRMQAALGAKTYHAVCQLRLDLEHRISRDTRQLASTTRYLEDHPNGVAGITAAQIRASIVSQTRALANERKTYVSLAGLGCPPPPAVHTS